MTIRVALIAVAFVAGIASASAAPVPKGTSGHLARGSYGCPMPGDVRDVLAVADKDMFRAREIGDALGCIKLEKGAAVIVEDEMKGGRGYACLKIEGRSKCIWTTNDNIVAD